MMESSAQDELKAHMLETDEEFREMAEQHFELDRQLTKLEAKHALTEEDKLEEVRLKKQKLHLKDAMTEMLNRHKTQHA